MPFDIDGARKAGYSDAEIADHLAQVSKFDAAGARKAGYTDAEILSHLQTQPAGKPPQRSGILDAPNAVASGFNRGLLRLVGLPVDTAANIIDLGKAALGAPYMAVSGKPAPGWLEPVDRSKVVGSSEYLIDKARGTSIGRTLIDPQNPGYEGGYLQMAGGSLTAMNPSTLPQAVVQAGGAVASSALAKAVGDATGDPSLSIAAAMSPRAAGMSAAAGAKYVVRGGEAGRREMAQRAQDFRNARVERPSVGQVSPNPFIQGAENVLSSTPGAINVMRKSREQMIADLQAATRQAADRAATTRGAEIAGSQIQRDIRGPFADRVRGNYETLIGRAGDAMGPNPMVLPADSVATARTLSAPQPGAKATSALLVQPRIGAVGNALASDSGGTPAQTLNGLLLDERGFPFQTVTAATPPQGIPFGSMRELRTRIGREGSSADVIGTPEQAELQQLYGAMSRDMREAARTADMNSGPQPNNMGRAERNLVRANGAYGAGMNRLERVESFAKTNAPEQVFNALSATTKENNSTLRAVKKSVTPETRATIASTVIDRLGRASPSNQNDVSDVFSAERFLTNWNNMTPAARRELFSGFRNADQVRAEVESIARATSIMRSNSKVFTNPSGTAANLAFRGAVGGGALGMLVDPLAPAYVGLGMGAANLTARAATNPGTVNWLAAPTTIDRRAVPREVNRLVGMGLLEQP